MKLFLLLFLCSSAYRPILGRVFDKCSLAREMSRLGVPRSQLPDWVCIAQHESSFSTHAMNTNSNKSKDWGLFQINDRYWCDPEDGRKTANECKFSCKQLLSDNIATAVRCAQMIKRQQGYTAWVAWKKYCRGVKPDTSKCFK